MSRGDCGDLLNVAVTCTAYKHKHCCWRLWVVAILKVMKQRCHLTKFHISDHKEFLKSNGVEVWLVLSF